MLRTAIVRTSTAPFHPHGAIPPDRIRMQHHQATGITCGCRRPVHLMRHGHVRGSADRVDRVVRPVRLPLERATPQFPAVASARASGAADARCSAPHGPTAPPADAVDHDQHPSSSSRRTVPHRSASAFARGARTGVGKIRMPSEAKTASKAALNCVSRSRTRNLHCWMRSARSMSRLRACWVTRCPVGLAVIPRTWTRRGKLDHQQHGPAWAAAGSAPRARRGLARRGVAG